MEIAAIAPDLEAAGREILGPGNRWPSGDPDTLCNKTGLVHNIRAGDMVNVCIYQSAECLGHTTGVVLLSSYWRSFSVMTLLT